MVCNVVTSSNVIFSKVELFKNALSEIRTMLSGTMIFFTFLLPSSSKQAKASLPIDLTGYSFPETAIDDGICKPAFGIVFSVSSNTISPIKQVESVPSSNLNKEYVHFPIPSQYTPSDTSDISPLVPPRDFISASSSERNVEDEDLLEYIDKSLYDVA